MSDRIDGGIKWLEFSFSIPITQYWCIWLKPFRRASLESVTTASPWATLGLHTGVNLRSYSQQTSPHITEA